VSSLATHDSKTEQQVVLVGQMCHATAEQVWTACAPRVARYGFAIEQQPLEPPRTGTFDGLRIVLDTGTSLEMRCFILLHLFGHSVQWTSPSLEATLCDLQHATDLEHFLTVLRAYEFQAARFGLQLLHEAGLEHLDAWYGDFVETDWRYVRLFYETGRIPDWNACIARGAMPVTPKPIPPIRQRLVTVRFAF